MGIGWLMSLAKPAPAPPTDIPASIVSAEDFCARALAWRDQGRYRLGGGCDGDSPSPLDDRGESECSRYLLWLWRLTKVLPDGLTMAGYGEVNTTALVGEARRRRVLVTEVPVERAAVGDGVVYPGLTVKGVRVKIGHCGGIVKVAPTIAEMRISHCNAGPAPAIDETNGRGFAAKGAIVVRLLRRW